MRRHHPLLLSLHDRLHHVGVFGCDVLEIWKESVLGIHSGNPTGGQDTHQSSQSSPNSIANKKSEIR